MLKIFVEKKFFLWWEQLIIQSLIVARFILRMIWLEIVRNWKERSYLGLFWKLLIGDKNDPSSVQRKLFPIKIGHVIHLSKRNLMLSNFYKKKCRSVSILKIASNMRRDTPIVFTGNINGNIFHELFQSNTIVWYIHVTGKFLKIPWKINPFE